MSDGERQRDAQARRDERERSLAFIGFAGEPGGSSYPLYECSTCGAAVSSGNTHIRWHATIAELAAKIAELVDR